MRPAEKQLYFRPVVLFLVSALLVAVGPQLSRRVRCCLGYLTVHKACLCSGLFIQATLLQTARKFEESEEIRRRVLDISRKMYTDAQDIRIMPHVSMLGQLLVHRKKYEEAEELLNLALEVRKKLLPTDNIMVACSKNGLGQLYCATGRLELAEKMLSESLHDAVKIVGAENPDVPQFRDDLAKVLIKLQRWSEAEPLLTAAIEQKERQSGKMHPDLAEFYQDLSELKRNTDCAEAADHAQKRAAENLAAIN